MKRPAAPFLLILLLFTVFAPSTQAQTDPGSSDGVTVPFTYDPPAIPGVVVPVSIDGHAPLPFLVDTGWSPALTIDSSVVDELGLHPDPTIRHSGPLPYRVASVKSVVIEGLRGSAVALRVDTSPVASLTLLQNYVGVHLAGIIGMPAFSTLPCQFDFEKRTLTFLYKDSQALSANSVALPLEPGTADHLANYVPVRLGQNSTVLLPLDTGSTNTSAPMSGMKGLKPLASTSEGYADVAGIYLLCCYRLSRIWIGNVEVHDADIMFVPPGTQTALGIDLLSQFRFTLDCPHQRLILEKGTQAVITPPHPGSLGLGVAQRGADCFIESVDPNSPAARAGIRPGDKIVSLDGYSSSGLAYEAIGRLVTGIAGATAQIVVERGYTTHSFSMVREDEFSEPKDVTDGIAMYIPANKAHSYTVLSVAPGCAAYRAGLRAQDQVIRLDGIPTTEIAIDQLTDLLDQPQLRLSVRRARGTQEIVIRVPAR